MDSFAEFINESIRKPTKKQAEFIESIKHQINIDIEPHIDLSMSKRTFITIWTDEMTDVDLTNVIRIANDKQIRHEPNGHKKIAFWI